MKKLELDITPIWINPFKTEKCVPSGSWTVCYWTWPSRNSEFSHTKMVMFHSFLYVYQRLIPAPFRRSQICALLSAGDESQRSALCFGWPVVYRARPPQPGGVFHGYCKFGQPLSIRVPWKYVGYDFGKYPLVNRQKTMEITIFYRKTHYKLPFSIAMLNYQRVPSPVYGSIPIVG